MQRHGRRFLQEVYEKRRATSAHKQARERGRQLVAQDRELMHVAMVAMTAEAKLDRKKMLKSEHMCDARKRKDRPARTVEAAAPSRPDDLQ